MNIREILNKLDTLGQSLSEMTWQDIYNLNKDQIKNPNLIYPNQQLKMPDGSTYTVQPGDNLSKISKTFQPAEKPAKVEPEKAEPAKTEPTKTEPEKTEPVKQAGQEKQTPVVKKEPTSDYDPDISHDIHRPTGFQWGNIRSNADTDYSTGDIGFGPDGGPYIRTPFQKSKSAVPQTGGTFNSNGYDANVGLDALDALMVAAGLKEPGTEKPATQSGQKTTPDTPSPKPSATTPKTDAPTPKPAKKERPVIGRPD